MSSSPNQNLATSSSTSPSSSSTVLLTKPQSAFPQNVDTPATQLDENNLTFNPTIASPMEPNPTTTRTSPLTPVLLHENEQIINNQENNDNNNNIDYTCNDSSTNSTDKTFQLDDMVCIGAPIIPPTTTLLDTNNNNDTPPPTTDIVCQTSLNNNDITNSSSLPQDEIIPPTPIQQRDDYPPQESTIQSTLESSTTTTTTTTTTLTPTNTQSISSQASSQQQQQLLQQRPAILRASLGTKRGLSRSDEDNNSNDVNKRQRHNPSDQAASGVSNNDTLTANNTQNNTLTSNLSAPTTTTTTTTTQNNNANNTNVNRNGVANQHLTSSKVLVQQFKEMSRNPPSGISIDIDHGNLHKWKVVMLGPPGTPFEGGIFPCTMVFPPNYPTSPPIFSFLTPNFPHPNVFADGKVCISILHDSTDPHYQHEPQSERWKPILGVEAILLSVMSLLTEPNTDSPANVEMSNLFKHNPREYRKKVILAVRRSQEDALNSSNE